MSRPLTGVTSLGRAHPVGVTLGQDDRAGPLDGDGEVELPDGTAMAAEAAAYLVDGQAGLLRGLPVQGF